MDSPPCDDASSPIMFITGDHIGADRSKASSELRKANKPLMEKRRRARINKSLNELKSILMESMERNSPGHSKWEKADILEMTVQYLHCLRNQRKACKFVLDPSLICHAWKSGYSNTQSARTDPLAVGQFIAGYSECIRQVQKFAFFRNSNSKSPSSETQEKLTAHLLTYLKTFSDDATRNFNNRSSSSSTTATTDAPRCPSPPIGGSAGESISSPSSRSIVSSLASPSCRSHESTDEDEGSGGESSYFIGDRGKDQVGVWRPW